MTDILKIGNAQAFWGDSPGAPARLVQQQPDLDYLTLDYLAEVSLSIMAIQKEKNPQLGYAVDFLDVIRSLIPFWKKGSKVKIVCNAGGLNPEGCAEAVTDILKQQACGHLQVFTVTGDSVLDLLKKDPQNALYKNLETGKPLTDVLEKLVTANAYLGANPIAKAIQKGADIVITGRVADPSLTVGPCLAHFGWKTSDYNKIAQATVGGHLIECGTQVTGGVCTNWLEIEDPAHIGFPILEMGSDSSFIITKPNQTSGFVNEQTIKEQLLYEIGDPDRYLSPDVTVSFLSIKLETVGKDRIRILGAKGTNPPSTLKVSATYREGYRSEGMLTIFGSNAIEKGMRCGEIVLQKVKDAGFEFDDSCIECLGRGDSVPIHSNQEKNEIVLRIAVKSSKKEAIEAFTKELAPLVTAGPQGIGGYIAGRSSIRDVFGYWPCLIDSSFNIA